MRKCERCKRRLPIGSHNVYVCPAGWGCAHLVRYVSPFGSPAWMTREHAQELLVRDDIHYLDLQKDGLLSEHQRAVGSPRIEHG